MVTVSISEPGRRAPAATFEQPESMLLACHQRVLRMCTLIERLREHAASHGADEQARQAAKDVLRYFDIAGPLHHEDEELHLFPRMRDSSDARQHELERTLHAQHLQMGELWTVLRTELMAMRDGDTTPLLTTASAQPFVQAYRQHVALEENEAYPLVFATLDAATLEAMGNEMAQRRTGK